MSVGLGVNIAVVLVFVLIGGFFAAAEMALVSLRESQVRRMADESRRGRIVAQLHREPNQFLAAVQIGVTFAGFLSAAFGASTIADELSPVFTGWGMSSRLADAAALVSITLVISYVSLVLGELAPKRLALQRAEGLARVVAPVIVMLSRVSRPVIWLLSRSTDIVVRVLGGDPRAAREAISEQELRDLVVGHAELDAEEREILDEVFSLNERQLREIMIPRTDVDFIAANTPVLLAARQVAGRPHSRYPVVKGGVDEVVGFVHVRDLLDLALKGSSQRVGEIARDVGFMPGTKPALSALTEMRKAGQHLAIVVDEYGGTDGIVTLEDLVEELVGDIRDEYDESATSTTRLGGTVEVDGMLNLDDFLDETGLTLPDGPYETVAGFVVRELGRVPRLGDAVPVDGHELEVTEVEGRRATRIRVRATFGAGATALDARTAPHEGDAPASG